MEYNPQFWQALDQLLARSALVIDRPKGSSHPRFPEMVYPLDYGYLENTASMDGEGVDVWVGTAQPPVLDGLLWVVDLPKGDVELVPRVGNHVVYLGRLDGYEHKLARLKEFYEKGLSRVGWDKYSRISVEFDNQVICTKRRP